MNEVGRRQSCPELEALGRLGAGAASGESRTAGAGERVPGETGGGGRAELRELREMRELRELRKG